MDILKVLLLLFSFNVVAGDLSIGVGNAWKSDYYGEQTYIDLVSVTFSEKDWKVSAQYFDNYNRSPWADTNPEFGNVVIPKHLVLSATAEVFSFDIDDFTLFVDFGVSYVDRLSHVNSSHVLFHENFGFRYNNVTIYLSHTSNAGIIPPNTGEDSIIMEFRL